MDPSGAGGPPAGWYPDPAGVKAWRWWDGTTWTSYASDPSPPAPPATPGQPAAPIVPGYPATPAYPAAPGSPGYPTYPGYPIYPAYPAYPAYGAWTATPSPEVSVAAEGRNAVWAMRAVVVYVLCQLASQAIQWTNRANLREALHRLRVQIDTGVVQQHTTLNGSAGRQAATDLFVLGLAASAVLFLVWQHRAARTARLLSLPASHSPAMGVGSWFIPVVNFWFPYQALRDCFPPGDPGRRLVLRMWVCFLALAVAGIVNTVTIFVGPSPTSGLDLIIVLIAAGLSITVGAFLFRIVGQVGEAHRRLAASTHSTGSGQPS